MVAGAYTTHRDWLSPARLAVPCLLLSLLLSHCTPQQRPPESPTPVQDTEGAAAAPEGQPPQNPPRTPEEQLELFNANLDRA